MSENNVAELLSKGIEAARDGERVAARELLEQVVELDEKNEKGWFWLASVVDTDEERRVCLKNVLHINPNNERAKSALEKLETRITRNTELGDKTEVAPGIPRSQLTLLIGGGVVGVIVIVIVILLVSIGNNSRIAAEQASTQQAVVDLTSTEVQNTALAAVATSTAEAATAEAIALTETQFAIVSPTPTPSETRRAADLLPPTWTPTPEATATPTRARLAPPPPQANGRIAVYGGDDARNLAYLPVGYYDLGTGGQYARVGDAIGLDPSIFPDGQRMVYTRYNQNFGAGIEAVNLNGTNVESIQSRWTPFASLTEVDSPSLSADGRLLAFTAIPLGGVTSQVFVLDLSVSVPDGANATNTPNPLRQITNDSGGSFSSVAISRDGARIVTVRTDTVGGTNATDLQVIDVASGAVIPVTNDQAAYVEAQPYWLPDGSQIVYATAESSDLSNFDIVAKSVSGGSPTVLVRDPADDRSPVISPSGQFMAYSSNRSGVWDVYILDLQTRETYQLTATEDEEYPTDWWMP